MKTVLDQNWLVFIIIAAFFELINGNTYLLIVTRSNNNASVIDFDVQAVSLAPQAFTDSAAVDGNSWSEGVPDNTKSALFNGNYNKDFDPESINACSVTISSNASLRSVEEEVNRLWLVLESDTYSASAKTLIGFLPAVSPAFDLGYDSDLVDTNVNLFSVIDDNRQLSIQGRESFNTDIEIPLGISNRLIEELSATISITQIEGIDLAQSNVFLIDAFLHTETNRKEENYTFSLQEGVFDTRFKLVFRSQALDLDEDSFVESTSNLSPNTTYNQLIIK